MTIANDIKKVETAFVNNLGAGRSATVNLYLLCVHAAQHRDVTVLLNAQRRAAKKGDDVAARLVKKTIAALYPKGEASEGGFKLNKSQHDQAIIENLAKAVKAGLSIRGAKFNETVFGKSAKAYDLSDAAKAFVAKAVKEGHSKAAAIAAVQAVEVEVKKAA